MADREDIARLLRAYEVETPVARYPEDYLDLADRILARLRSEPPHGGRGAGGADPSGDYPCRHQG